MLPRVETTRSGDQWSTPTSASAGALAEGVQDVTGRVRNARRTADLYFPPAISPGYCGAVRR